jgi:hypothetical protein
VFVAALACITVRLAALDVSVDDADLRRASRIARGDSRARDAFHRTYTIQLASGDLQQIEVITELRRAVLLAADRNRVGEPEDAAIRRLQQALAPFRGRVALVLHARFSPQTALVTLPQYELRVSSLPSGPAERVLDVRRTPIYSTGGRNTFLAGADVEAVFDAAAIGQTKRRVAVDLDRKELTAVSVDFASLE